MFGVVNAGSKLLLAPGLPNISPLLANAIQVRLASKKTGSSTRNPSSKRKPKHRGIHFQDGSFVQEGALLLTQNKLRMHPGLNVGIGGNMTLFAMIPGRVMITCEKIDPDMTHSWNIKWYGGRNLERVHKKFMHVLPQAQHYRFKMISE